jgi:hypothetical protein
MASPMLAVINADVQALMGVEDKGVWEAEGLFASVDTLSSCTASHKYTPTFMTSLASRPKSLTSTEFQQDTVSFSGLTDFPSDAHPSDLVTVLREKQSRAFTGPNSSEGLPSFLPQGGRRLWRPNKAVQKMVLGSDVGLDETCRLLMCNLVGRLSYRNLGILTLPVWVEQVWTPLLGYTPKLLTLTKAWFGFFM